MTKTDQKELQELIDLHQRVEHLETLAKGAKALLRERIPDYARLHFRAAQVAAERGDSRAAEWALATVRTADDAPPVVEPPSKRQSEGGQIKVLINIPMGLMPPGVMSDGHVVELPASPAEHSSTEEE